MAGERQLQPTAETETVDGGDHGHAQGLDPVEQAVDLADSLDDLIFRGDRLEFAHVGAGDEARSLAGYEDETLQRAGCRALHSAFVFRKFLRALRIGLDDRLDPIDDRAQFLQHAAAQRVGALAFAIDHRPGDALDVDGELPVMEGEGRQGGGHGIELHMCAGRVSPRTGEGFAPPTDVAKGGLRVVARACGARQDSLVDLV